jgi:FkbM family methyltransferase
MNQIASLVNTLSIILFHPLNRARKFHAFLKFFQWQLSTRILRAPVLISWVDDAKMIVSNGETGLTGNIYCGLLEFEEMAFLLSALRQSDLFIDVGANIGAYTILASKVIGAETIAFEPIPTTFIKLRQQLVVNQIQNKVDLRNFGVGANCEKLHFTTHQDTVNKVSLDKNISNSILVDVVTLDTQINTNKCIMLKIDIEGFEYAALQGASNLLKNPALEVIIIEMNNSGVNFGHTNNDIHNLISEFGFFPYEYNPWDRSLKELPRFSDIKNNAIYIKDVNKIKNRLTLSPLHTIHTSNGISI